jgi:pantothenate kinase
VAPDSPETHPPRIRATAASLAGELRNRLVGTPDRVIVGICGAPGAGKSTLAATLAGLLGPEVVAVVPFDGFHLASSVLAGTPLAHRRGAIDTFDVGSYLALMRRLRARDEDIVYAPAFDRAIEEPIASAIAIPRGIPLIITEGNYLLADEPRLEAVRGLIDTVWYLDTPPEVRLPQLVARHVEFGKPEHEAEAWAAGTDQRNAEAIEARRERADVIISLEA